MILPAIAFVVYAFLSDRGLQKVALVAGTLLYIVVLNLACSASAFSGDGFFYTLGVADGFGGTFAEFAIISLPVLFLSDSRRPLFAASLGVTIDFLLAGILWLGPEWMPDALILSPGLQVLAFAVITSAAFLAVALYLTERTKEASLAQALAVFYAGAGRKRTRTPISEQVGKIAEGDTGAGTDAGIVVDANTDTGVGASMTAGAGADADMRAIPGMDMGAGANILVPDIFLPEEQQIAALVFEGFTKGEIARKLHMQSSDVANTIAKVRTKITGASESTDAGIFANAVKVYGLTNREAQILRGIYEGRTNAEMASLHFLSEATVKFHVRNVLRKLQVDGRVQVKDLLLSLADSGERSDH
jgi:DNA-binding NarL/FixJ family response regulator